MSEKKLLLQAFRDANMIRGSRVNLPWLINAAAMILKPEPEDYHDIEVWLKSWLLRNVRHPHGTFIMFTGKHGGIGIRSEATEPVSTPTTKFKLRIELGNAEMFTRRHLGRALRQVATMVESAAFATEDTHKVFDANGNSVGHWLFTTEAEE